MCIWAKFNSPEAFSTGVLYSQKTCTTVQFEMYLIQAHSVGRRNIIEKGILKGFIHSRRFTRGGRPETTKLSHFNANNYVYIDPLIV